MFVLIISSKLHERLNYKLNEHSINNFNQHLMYQLLTFQGIDKERKN